MPPAAPSRRPAPGEGPRSPNVAALLTWFLPGAGHLYAGRPVRGLIAFAMVAGLYRLGVELADGLTFQFLDPELRGPFAPALSPEIGFVGGFLWQVWMFGFGNGQELPPDTLRLGSTLAALAGMLNVLWMVQAHDDARRRTEPLRAHAAERRPLPPAVQVGAAWLVPGLGHWLQGRRARAAMVFGLLVGLFAFGTVLAEATNLSRERHFYYWAGQFVLGLPALVSEALWGDARVTGPIPLVDAGLVFGCVAGLLNVLAMIDVYGGAERQVYDLPAEDEPRAEGARDEDGADRLGSASR